MNSEHTELTEDERHSRVVAKFISYVLDSGEFEGFYTSEMVQPYLEAAESPHGNPELFESMVQFLGNALRSMSREQESRVLYNGRSRMARRLADWWDEHQGCTEDEEDERMYMTDDMLFLYEHLELNKDNSGFIRRFLKEFLHVMLVEDHSMTFLNGMERVMEICDLLQKRNGK